MIIAIGSVRYRTESLDVSKYRDSIPDSDISYQTRLPNLWHPRLYFVNLLSK